MESTPPPAGLRLGVAEGVIPKKWLRRWSERHPTTPLEVVPCPAFADDSVLATHGLDAAILRAAPSPGSHAIPMYEEIPVVVVPTDHYFTAAAQVRSGDLREEIVHRPVDGPDAPILGIPAEDRSADTLAAIQLVAAGVGVVVVPKSLARLHHRKDLTRLPVADLPPIGVSLQWRRGEEDPLIEDLIGVVRGRTVNSTRGTSTSVPKRTAAQKAEARRAYLARKRGPAEASRGGRGSRGGGRRGQSGRNRGR